MNPTEAFPEETSRCRAAQRSWSTLSLRRRLRCVRRLRHLFAETANTLALTVTQDIGRSADEVLVTDIMPTADACRFLEKQARRILKPRRIPLSQRPLWLLGSVDWVQRRPHGVVGVIGTWNYPIYLNAIQIAQALTAGNGVIWKPSELTPTTAAFIHDLFVRAGFPANLFVRLPATREAGPVLAESDINYMVFTGSAEVGRKLARRLGERLIPCTLELSGCDALIVCADADIEMAAKAAWFGVTLNSGQTCLALRRIFVERSRYAEFLEKLRRHAAGARAGPLALISQAKQAERLVASAVEAGGRLLIEDAAPRAEDEPPRFPPTFVINTRPEMAIAQEASFAPIAAIMPYDSMPELLRWLEMCPYSLGVSIFARDRAQALALAERMDSGSVTINDAIAATAHPAAPFGGSRSSGWGVTQGPEGLLAMTVPQAISYRKGTYRPHYQMDKDPATMQMMHGLLHWNHARGWEKQLSGLWQMMRGAISALNPWK
jgi:acyl-CoA reductase-like NAD-dependent aldehyde dehydrogenase